MDHSYIDTTKISDSNSNIKEAKDKESDALDGASPHVIPIEVDSECEETNKSSIYGAKETAVQEDKMDHSYVDSTKINGPNIKEAKDEENGALDNARSHAISIEVDSEFEDAKDEENGALDDTRSHALSIEVDSEFEEAKDEENGALDDTRSHAISIEVDSEFEEANKSRIYGAKMTVAQEEKMDQSHDDTTKINDSYSGIKETMSPSIFSLISDDSIDIIYANSRISMEGDSEFEGTESSSTYGAKTAAQEEKMDQSHDDTTKINDSDSGIKETMSPSIFSLRSDESIDIIYDNSRISMEGDSEFEGTESSSTYGAKTAAQEGNMDHIYVNTTESNDSESSIEEAKDGGNGARSSGPIRESSPEESIKSEESNSAEKPNTYGAKKNAAQGMMDIALITANANQLRYLIEFNRNNWTFYYILALIITSLGLQVFVGVALIFKGQGKSKDERKRINNYIVVAIFFITIINVFIASFTITGDHNDNTE